MIARLTSGERCRIDNPAYLEALNVRGNHPNLQYHFLTMLKECRIDVFLYYFPWYGAHFNGIFGAFYRQFINFSRGVYQAYVDRYIRKVTAVGGFQNNICRIFGGYIMGFICRVLRGCEDADPVLDGGELLVGIGSEGDFVLFGGDVRCLFVFCCLKILYDL